MLQIQIFSTLRFLVYNAMISKNFSIKAAVLPISDSAPSVQTSKSLVNLLADFLDMTLLPQICLTLWLFHSVTQGQ